MVDCGLDNALHSMHVSLKADKNSQKPTNTPAGALKGQQALNAGKATVCFLSS